MAHHLVDHECGSARFPSVGPNQGSAVGPTQSAAPTWTSSMRLVPAWYQLHRPMCPRGGLARSRATTRTHDEASKCMLRRLGAGRSQVQILSPRYPESGCKGGISLVPANHTQQGLSCSFWA